MKKILIQKGLIFAALSVLLSSFAAIASAQEFRGTITGKVSDPNGAIIPGAAVVIKNVDTNIEATLKTNDEGVYVAALLNPGKYSVAVPGTGFRKSLREQVMLNVGDRLSLDFQLEVGNEAQQVTIVADTELVEKGSVTTGTVVSGRQIEELPLSEGAAYNLALQAPGVAYTGNPLFTGPTSNGNLATMDGASAFRRKISLSAAAR